MTTRHQAGFHSRATWWKIKAEGLLENSDSEFETATAEIRRYGKISRDPDAYLTSREAHDRMLAMSELACRNSWETKPGCKFEELDKERTASILDSLLELPFESEDRNVRDRAWVFNNILGDNLARLGYRIPAVKPGDDAAKIQNEAMNEFIRTNRDRIVLKRPVAGK